MKSSPDFPDFESVTEESDADEVRKMLRDGWRLLCPPARVSGMAGEYFVWPLGKPRKPGVPFIP